MKKIFSILAILGGVLMLSCGCASDGGKKKVVRKAAVVAGAGGAAMGSVVKKRAKAKAKDKVTPEREILNRDEDEGLGLRDRD